VGDHIAVDGAGDTGNHVFGWGVLHKPPPARLLERGKTGTKYDTTPMRHGAGDCAQPSLSLFHLRSEEAHPVLFQKCSDMNLPMEILFPCHLRAVMLEIVESYDKCLEPVNFISLENVIVGGRTLLASHYEVVVARYRSWKRARQAVDMNWSFAPFAFESRGAGPDRLMATRAGFTHVIVSVRGDVSSSCPVPRR